MLAFRAARASSGNISGQIGDPSGRNTLLTTSTTFQSLFGASQYA
jgi:hypothetical protein